MRLPSAEALKGLVGWEAPYGVLSVYVAIDPGDRGGAWKIALRDQIDAAVEAADAADRAQEIAIKATAARIRERFEPSTPPSGRMQIGFVACAPKPAGEVPEEWFAVQFPVERTRVAYGRRPNLRRLAEIVDDGRPRAVVALSSERVRLFEWRHGEVTELAERELELLEAEWRERKAPRMRDPASGHAVSSAGRDQHDQRLDQHRKRFLKGSAAAARAALGDGAADELLCIGDPGLCEAFLGGWDSPPRDVTVEPADVITEPAAVIAERATAKLVEADAARDAELVERALGAAQAAGGAGALGLTETARALARGQVERLLIDADREIPADGIDDGLRAELEAVSPLPSGGLDEWIVEEAIRTSAAITAIRAQPAERLAEHGGVGALLRY
ncbi:MAG TPA: VLRF1 family aeRF1-type release factor [Solirubrobacterales bacterium]